MDEIQVDPKLFVTCRLCLEDLGQYQIVPSVQQQIKYCFDIDVEPFDGLPQLICTKCKEILSRFHTIKTTFCEKQTNLRTKVIKNDEIFCIQPQQDTVSSSQQALEPIEPPPSTNQIINEPRSNTKKKKFKSKTLFQHSSSSSELESEQSFQTTKSHKKKSSRRKNKSPMPWEADYKKLIACKLCNSAWLSRKSLAVHNRSHELLRQRYKNIFKRQCLVKLIKIDDKPNLTGLSTMVVHSINKIIEPGNSYFSTIYTKEDVASTNNLKSSDINNEDKNKYFSQESSDGEDRIVFKRKQRKRRLLSRSSNETVVIESNSNKVLSDEEDSKSTVLSSIDRPQNIEQCINIDDSSDSESDQSKLETSGKVKKPVEAKFNDFKVIQGIMTMCVNSSLKKNESPEVDMLYMNVNQHKKKYNISNESQLIHKVLSIGRKIINKQGFNCTGLLRYMEQKHLGIVWIAKAQPLLNSKDTNYIRILTRLRGNPILDDESAWLRASKKTHKKPSSLVTIKKSVKKASKPLSNVTVTSDSTVTKIATNMLANVETSQPELINNQAKLDSMPAMLSYIDSKASTSDSKKLLNANPVANPKQLPKKLGPGNESRTNKTTVQQTVVSQPTNDDTNYCLPIITSTTSLAAIPSKDCSLLETAQDANQKNTDTSQEINKTEAPAAPRIKVKPASELMSVRTLDRMKEQSAIVTNNNMFVSQIENVWPHQHSMNVFVPNIAPQILATSPPVLLQLTTINAETAYQPVPGPITSNTKTEYVILDTPDFPNTRTESPIRYVKDLLQLHNIFLLDPNEPISRNFICLIKFKVVFKQDYQRDSPVILCLSLSCMKNTFCFQVRDRNHEIIDMTKISANWQWEILQTYRGDVSNKVLQNAQKSGQETFNLTNKFFCLLKAINCRKP